MRTALHIAVAVSSTHHDRVVSDVKVVSVAVTAMAYAALHTGALW